MGFLTGKNILITGMLSNRSIAYGIARAMSSRGRRTRIHLSGRGLQESRRRPGRANSAADLVFPCDVTSDAGNRCTVRGAGRALGRPGRNGAFHRLRPARGSAGDYLDSISPRSVPHRARHASYSFAALAKAALPMMQGRQRGAADAHLSGCGAHHAELQRDGTGQGQPGSRRALHGRSLGPKDIRVNAISAGPIKTLAAAGIGSFGKLLAYNERTAPLRRNVTIDEVGNVAAFLCSDLSSGITGEVTYVDAGFSMTAFNTGGLAASSMACRLIWTSAFFFWLARLAAAASIPLTWSTCRVKPLRASASTVSTFVTLPTR